MASSPSGASAPAAPQSLTDRDLASAAEALALARKARAAQRLLAEFSQAQIDAIVARMAAVAEAHAEPLARLAVEETGYGVVADKVAKNLFAARDVHAFIRPMQTVGVVARHEDRKIVEIAEPFGVVAAIVPSTNPTSTAIYKLLISIKARCGVVLSPHPSAARCITRTATLLNDAAREAGLPEGAIGWLTTVTLHGTRELMRARDIAVILATGGLGLVRAAYSAGKPAYGVGPGNALGRRRTLVAVLDDATAAGQSSLDIRQQPLTVQAFRRDGIETAQLIFHRRRFLLCPLPRPRRGPRRSGPG